jgi:hypothetical protein
MTVWSIARGWWRRQRASHGRDMTVTAGIVVVVSAGLAVVSDVARSIAGLALRYGSIAAVVYLAFDLVLRFSRGPSAFDGAGEEFHGPSARAAVILIVAVVAAIALNWVGGGWALNQAYGSGSPLPSGLLDSAAR